MTREMMKAFVRDPLKSENSDIAARIYSDIALWPEFESAFYPEAEPTEEERRTIDRFVGDHCSSDCTRQAERLRTFMARRLEQISGDLCDFALAAVRRDGSANAAAPKEAAEAVTFVFVSASWRAELTLPAKAGVTDMLPIVLTDAYGEPLDGGLFNVAGVSLPVARGHAEIPYGLFLSGLKDPSVAFVDGAGKRTEGTLALF